MLVMVILVNCLYIIYIHVIKGSRTPEVQTPPLKSTLNESYFWGKNNSNSIIHVGT